MRRKLLISLSAALASATCGEADETPSEPQQVSITVVYPGGVLLSDEGTFVVAALSDDNGAIVDRRQTSAHRTNDTEVLAADVAPGAYRLNVEVFSCTFSCPGEDNSQQGRATRRMQCGTDLEASAGGAALRIRVNDDRTACELT